MFQFPAMVPRHIRRISCTPKPPPGVLRLGLSEDALTELHVVARQSGPAPALDRLVSSGKIRADSAQTACATHLQTVWGAAQKFGAAKASWRLAHVAWLADVRAGLRRLRAEESRQAGARKKSGQSEEHDTRTVESKRTSRNALWIGRPRKPVLSHQGCFVWGGVGRGKSLLMDIFVSSLSASHGPVVHRQHYHEFMQAVHEQLHKLRQAGAAREAVRLVAARVAAGCPAILCLDEFQVTNIADAVILRILFEGILAQDVIAVFTSNRPPSDLYKDGLNHMIYMPPFIRLLEDRLAVHFLDSPSDYRAMMKTQEAAASSMMSAGRPRPDFLVGPELGDEDLQLAFEAAAATADVATTEPRQLDVAWGRKLTCWKSCGGVAQFAFDELCGSALSADDYLALVGKNSVHTVVLSNVPRFTVEQHNEARRFTNLVDCLYENQCRLVCTASIGPEELMSEMEILSHVPIAAQPGMGIAGSEKSIHKHGDITFEVSASSPCRPDTFATAEADAEAGHGEEIMTAIRAARKKASGSLRSDPTEQDGVAGVMSAALVSLQESGFGARRCVSRLLEMGTAEYLAAHKAKWLLQS